jgi:hypothetical protein
LHALLAGMQVGPSLDVRYCIWHWLALGREGEREEGPALIKKRTSSVLLLPSHGVRLSHGPELLV